MKHEEFFNRNVKFAEKIFNGPYITHEPEIKYFDLKKTDQTLIMASDGFWDFMDEESISNVLENKEEITEITER